MNLDKYIVSWMRECRNSDAREFASVGFKSSGIEHKIMTGTLGTHGSCQGDELSLESMLTDRVVSLLRRNGHELEVLFCWYRNGKSSRAVTRKLGITRYETRDRLRAELAMFEGALLVALELNSL